LARMFATSRAFAEFDGLHLRGFPWRAQIALSPLCLPISPLGLAWFAAEPMFRLATLGLFQLYLSTGPYITPSSQRAVGAICTKVRETRAISSSAPTSPMRKRLDKGDFKSLVFTDFTTGAARNYASFTGLIAQGRRCWSASSLHQLHCTEQSAQGRGLNVAGDEDYP
jgi:hypothetical protein